jgi:hypothetical protein
VIRLLELLAYVLIAGVFACFVAIGMGMIPRAAGIGGAVALGLVGLILLQVCCSLTDRDLLRLFRTEGFDARRIRIEDAGLPPHVHAAVDLTVPSLSSGAYRCTAYWYAALDRDGRKGAIVGCKASVVVGPGGRRSPDYYSIVTVPCSLAAIYKFAVMRSPPNMRALPTKLFGDFVELQYDWYLLTSRSMRADVADVAGYLIERLGRSGFEAWGGRALPMIVVGNGVVCSAFRSWLGPKHATLAIPEVQAISEEVEILLRRGGGTPA